MALKRDSQSSIFETLAPKGTVNTPKEPQKAKKPPEKEPEKKLKAAENKEKPASVKKPEKGTEPKDEPAAKTTVPEIAKEEQVEKPVKAFDFGENKVRELKKVRKQFVFTKTYAEWISATARYNNMSENQVIENLIRMAMEQQ